MHTSGDLSDHLDQMKRMQPLPNEIPVFMSVNDILARKESLVVSLGALKVYSTGVEILLEIRQLGTAGPAPDFAARWGRRGREQFLLGVEFGDGRKAVSTLWPLSPLPAEPTTPVLSGGHGGGDSRVWTATFFLTPLPPEGPLSIAFTWPAREITETFVEVDGTAIGSAAASINELWPYDPMAENVPPPPPETPAVMPGGWFDQVIRGQQ